MQRTCPICKRPVPAEAESAPCRPFCSPRCKTIDLGGWLTEAYRISRPLAEEDLDEGAPPGMPAEPEPRPRSLSRSSGRQSRRQSN
jgi:hypothetical protein